MHFCGLLLTWCKVFIEFDFFFNGRLMYLENLIIVCLPWVGAFGLILMSLITDTRRAFISWAAQFELWCYISKLSVHNFLARTFFALWIFWPFGHILTSFGCVASPSRGPQNFKETAWSGCSRASTRGVEGPNRKNRRGYTRRGIIIIVINGQYDYLIMK